MKLKCMESSQQYLVFNFTPPLRLPLEQELLINLLPTCMPHFSPATANDDIFIIY